MPKRVLLIGLALALLLTACRPISPQQEEESILASLTVEEKVGQLLFIGIPGTSVAGIEALLNQLRPGGVILFGRNIESGEQVVDLLNELRSSPALPLPPLLGVDQEGGSVSRLPPGATRFPSASRLARLPEEAKALGLAMGKELAALGFNLNFAPVLDVNSNPANPVIGDRAYGHTPELVIDIGLDVMRGLIASGVVPVVKHFPGHGDTALDSHYQLPTVNEPVELLIARELAPFQAAVHQEAPAIMTAHVVFPALDSDKPATLSQPILTGLLRNEWGYDGVIITDDLEMGAVAGQEIGDLAVEAFLAGSDMLLICHTPSKQIRAFEALVTAVHNGSISEERLDQSVARIFALKDEYNLSRELASWTEANRVIGHPAHQDLVDRITGR